MLGHHCWPSGRFCKQVYGGSWGGKSGGSQFGASKQKVSLSFSQGRCERFHLNGDFDCLGLGDTQHCILADFLAVLVLPPEAAEWRSFVE